MSQDNPQAPTKPGVDTDGENPTNPQPDEQNPSPAV